MLHRYYHRVDNISVDNRGNFIMNKQSVRMMSTPEQLEYEELTKTMRLATAKLRIAQEGINTSSLSQQKFDMIMRIFDDMEHIQRDVQQKTSKIQQDSNIQIQKVNQDANKKMMDIQKRYQDAIKSLKDFQDSHLQGQIEEKAEEQVVEYVARSGVVEEVREKTYEEKVNDITDIVLREMRDSVYNKIDEIMKIVDTKTETTIGKGDNAVVEESDDHTRQTTVESAIMGDRPDDKDIPIITPEMMQKTEEEIARRKE